MIRELQWIINQIQPAKSLALVPTIDQRGAGTLFGALGLGTAAGLIGLISFAIPGLYLFATTGRMATILTFAAAGGVVGMRVPGHLN